MSLVATKSERIDIRTDPVVKELLQRAAAAHKSVSEFLLHAGLDAARETLSGRQIFSLDEDAWDAFQAVLERPVSDKPRLRRLLSEPGVFDSPPTRPLTRQ
uniref:Uncharacterized conserved protein, DUF1778 family n=1 Tax=Candidatus Kentrum sp. FM TaxID=2126340 RepID=A0A450U2R0_9GAMM|nr:MAG: Uncharacterized conserved protein, DUF1778 family [Candidatus Kentron sp. FM]VFJ77415.1 MAG: Uncharacterized conserved protein, DUF1778 family [Candidatus Kentron sp. FM]VFK24084.1 MAG: Uncharacterized conserved protein, DUF1778 family [Candidatus Kentron sp. FM]